MVSQSESPRRFWLKDAPMLSLRASAVITLVFLGLALLVMSRHELWRDEWQAWIIARESRSLLDLFQNIRYECHPATWHLVLFLISRFTANPLFMQIFHLFVAAGAVFLFLRFSPFPVWLKVMFAFSYFPFFEYGIISRDYSLGMLLLFSFCAIYARSPSRKYLLLGANLLLLSQTTVYGLIIAMALLAAVISESWLDGRLRAYVADHRGEVIFSLALTLVGFTLAIIQIIPPPDYGFAPAWFFKWSYPNLGQTLTTIWKSYVPIPNFNYQFWGTNIIEDPYVLRPLSLGLLIFCLLSLVEQPSALILFTVGSGGLLAFSYTKYFGYLRHHGHLFLLLVASLWFASVCLERPLSFPFLHRLSGFCRRFMKGLLLLLLSAQLVAGVTAATMDLYYPFSASKELVDYLKIHRLTELPLAGDIDYASCPVAGYLDRQIYFPRANRQGSFIIWDWRRDQAMTREELLERVHDFSVKRGKPVVLILTYPLEMPCPPAALLKRFSESIVTSETYYLYLLQFGQETGKPDPSKKIFQPTS